MPKGRQRDPRRDDSLEAKIPALVAIAAVAKSPSYVSGCKSNANGFSASAVPKKMACSSRVCNRRVLYPSEPDAIRR